MRKNVLIPVVIAALVSCAILSTTTVIYYGGMAASGTFAGITLAFYLTVRQRENTESPERKLRYRHRGLGIVTHAVGLCMICGTYVSREYWTLGLLFLILAVFFLYEGWRVWRGYKFFIPRRR